MGAIPLDKFNLNRFWEKTPTPLKYILIFAILLATSYFIFSKKMDDNHLSELDSMKRGIAATYELIDNFEDFRKEQDDYNKDVLSYLYDLHDLVDELNSSTNRKLDMILNSGSANTDQIIEKIVLLNESFDKLSNIYKEDLETPNLEDNKAPKKDYDYQFDAIPIDENGYALDKNGNHAYDENGVIRYDNDGNRIDSNGKKFSIGVKKWDGGINTDTSKKKN